MNEVIQALHNEIADADIDVQTSGAHISLLIKAPVFLGMRRIERQRYVKRILTPWIESGQLHAVSLRVEAKGEVE